MTETFSSEPEKIHLVYTKYIFLRFGISFCGLVLIGIYQVYIFKFGCDKPEDMTRI